MANIIYRTQATKLKRIQITNVSGGNLFFDWIGEEGLDLDNNQSVVMLEAEFNNKIRRNLYHESFTRHEPKIEVEYFDAGEDVTTTTTEDVTTTTTE